MGVRTSFRVAARSVLVLLLVGGAPTLSAAALPRITGIAATAMPDGLRVAITATGALRYQLPTVRPDWVVVDILDAELGTPPPSVPEPGGVVKQIRAGQFKPNVVRIVIELAEPALYDVTTSPDSTALMVTLSTDFQSEHAQPRPERARAVGDVQRIIPGQQIGPVKLGMNVQDVTAVLGRSTNTESLPDGSVDHHWLEPSKNSRLSVRVTTGGVVSRIWVRGDRTYAIDERLRLGSTESDVRTVLGEPSWVVTVESQGKMKTLIYESLGVWLGIQLDEQESLRQTVVEIGVMPPEQPR